MTNSDEFLNHFSTMTKLKLHRHFINACMKGNLDVVKYLLTSPDLEKNVDIHYKNDLALIRALFEKHIDIVKYLLTSPDLNEHANIHTQDDFIFKIVCSRDNDKLLEYFIWDYHIDKTPIIEQFLKEHHMINILDIFIKRNFNDDLKLNLKIKKSHQSLFHKI